MGSNTLRKDAQASRGGSDHHHGLKALAFVVLATAFAEPASAGCGSVDHDALAGKFSEAAAVCSSGASRAAAVPKTFVPAPVLIEQRAPVAIRMAGARRAVATAQRHGRGATAPARAALVQRVAASYRIDPALLASIVHTESAGRSNAVSHKGALGLMQVMPGTARAMGVTDPSRLLVDDELSLRTGARYLKQLQRQLGNNVVNVVAAYNAGPGAVMKAGMKVPKYRETQGYVTSVMGRYQQSRAR
ncbi:lytic transglycosylase domain-containing protein [Sphingomonas sp. 1P06PA]|uniref:lytic transglycosylase domain-containing protein n=1 Tax=Sphingomonas sp. 1P06PA TaxID=554121 RepID=UPI0039A6ED8A